MGCWVQSCNGKTYPVRDGLASDSPVLFVGVEPVWFENSKPERFLGDRELEVVRDRKAATSKEKADQAEVQAKIREARADRKKKNRALKYGGRAVDDLVAAAVRLHPEADMPAEDEDEDNGAGDLDPAALEAATEG